MCSLPGECGILSQASYPVLDKGKVLEALKIARDEEKLKVDILSLMRSIDPEILVGGCFPHFYDGPIIPFFFDMFWLTKQGMVMNVYEWLILALSSVTYPLWLLLPHCSALQRSKSMSWMVNPCQSLIISGEIVFFFRLSYV